MKDVLILGGGDYNSEIRKVLLDIKNKESVLLRLGSLERKVVEGYSIHINSYDSNRLVLDRVYMKELMLDNDISTLPYHTSISLLFPFILKGKWKIEGIPSLFYIENNNDLKTCKSFTKRGWYIEPIFRATSEYRLYCTKEEVFYSEKKLKETNDILIRPENSTNIFMNSKSIVKFPRLWEKIKKTALKIMLLFDLDIASIDIGYKSGDSHSFIVHKVTPHLVLSDNIIKPVTEQICKIINKKINGLQ